MKYLDFVVPNYAPAKSDLICDFFVETERGTDVKTAAGGIEHGHPRGSRAGATAMRQAVDAAVSGASLKEYANSHTELKEALEHFGK